MNDTVHDGHVHRAPLAILDRAAIVAALAFAIAVFLKIGWPFLVLEDPLSAITLLRRDGRLLVFVQISGLASVVAAIASLVAARRFPDIGPLCVAVGLAVLSLYGGTAEALLTEARGAGDGALRRLSWQFVLESLFWFVPIALAVGVSAFCLRRFSMAPPSERATAYSDPAQHGLLPSGLEVFFLRGIPAPSSPLGTGLTAGLKHTLIAAAAGVLAITILSTGSGFRAIRHGQVCFTIAAGMLIGSYAALNLAPVRSALWSMLATPFVAILGYAWASWSDAPLTSPFLRFLPLQMISVGIASALTTIWYHYAPEVDLMNEGAGEQGGPSAGGRT